MLLSKKAIKSINMTIVKIANEERISAINPITDKATTVPMTIDPHGRYTLFFR